MRPKVWILFLAFIGIITSCKKNENNISDVIIPDDLFGTWKWEISELWVGQTTEYYLLTLSKVDSENGLYETNWIADWTEANVFHVLEAQKGTFTVNKNIMYMVATHFGSEIGLDDVTIYDTTMWWGQSDPEFSNFEQEDTSVLFTLSGDSLIILVDENKDGDFDDPDDNTLIFLRIE